MDKSARIDELITICDTYGAPILKMWGNLLGSEYKRRKSGTHGEYGVYSFNGNMIITTSGGGALISIEERALQEG